MNRMKLPWLIAYFFTFISIFIGVEELRAQEIVWTWVGITSSDWTESSNWTSTTNANNYPGYYAGPPPVPLEHVYIPSNAPADPSLSLLSENSITITGRFFLGDTSILPVKLELAGKGLTVMGSVKLSGIITGGGTINFQNDVEVSGNTTLSTVGTSDGDIVLGSNAAKNVKLGANLVIETTTGNININGKVLRETGSPTLSINTQGTVSVIESVSKQSDRLSAIIFNFSGQGRFASNAIPSLFAENFIRIQGVSGSLTQQLNSSIMTRELIVSTKPRIANIPSSISLSNDNVIGTPTLEGTVSLTTEDRGRIHLVNKSIGKLRIVDKVESNGGDISIEHEEGALIIAYPISTPQGNVSLKAQKVLIETALGTSPLALGSMIITASLNIELGGDIVTNSGGVSFMGPLEVTNDLTIDSGGPGANILFESTINGDRNNHTMRLDAGAGSISTAGEIGNSIPIGTLDVEARGGFSQGGKVTLAEDLIIQTETPYELNGHDLMIGGRLNCLGTLRAQDLETITIKTDIYINTFEPALSKVVLDGNQDGSIDTLESARFYDLTINKTSSSISSSNNGITVINSLQMLSGTWNAGNGLSHTISGNWDSRSITFRSDRSLIVLADLGDIPPASLPQIFLNPGEGFHDLEIKNSRNAASSLELANKLSITETAVLFTGLNNSITAGGDVSIDLEAEITVGFNGNLKVDRDLRIAGTLELQGNRALELGRNLDITDGAFLYPDNGGRVTFNGGRVQKLTSAGSDLNNIEINNASTLNLNDKLTINNGLFITNGAFNPGNHTINFQGSLWSVDSNNGSFDHSVIVDEEQGERNRRVVFANSGITNISGKSTFFDFVCSIPGAQLQFAVGTEHLQTINNLFFVTGIENNQIRLTGNNSTNHWFINVKKEAFIKETYVEWSSATSPILLYASCIDGGYTINWFFTISIESSYAEDSDRNGKIDTIRVRVKEGTVLSTATPYDPGRVKAEVQDQEVLGISSSDKNGAARVSDNEFFIHLEEPASFDTSSSLRWKLTANGRNGIESSSDSKIIEYGAISTWNDTVDRAPPKITLSLAVANGRNEIFVRFSELVRQHNGDPIAADNFRYNGKANIIGMTRIDSSDEGTSEILLLLDSPVTADEVLNYQSIEVLSYIDDMTRVTFPNSPPPPSDPLYPSPGDPLLEVGTTHRVSDLALGIVGDGVIEAVYGQSATIEVSEGGPGRVSNFDGSDYLQWDDIYIEAHIHNDYASPGSNSPNVDIVYALNVPSNYRSDGLWLPSSGVDGIFDLVAETYPNTVSIAQRSANLSNVQLRGFDIPKESEQLENRGLVDFFFRINRSPQPLYGARVISESSMQWYSEIRPWSFTLRDILRQKGRVTILNNIFNPEKEERSAINYILDKGGNVSIQVFDLSGGKVMVLQQGFQEAGEYTIAWTGRNMSEKIVSRGIYFIRIVGPGGVDEIRKVLVVR